MANAVSIYDPIFYAQESLIALTKALGLANRVHRGYDKTPSQKGSIIQIKVPSVFTAQNAPATAQAVNANMIAITLNNWQEVKFSLTDKELSFTGEQIITDHIKPAAYALADAIDQSVAGLFNDVPWTRTWSSPKVVADITGVRGQLFANKVPMHDDNLHFMLDGQAEADLLGLQAFAQFQGAGPAGVDTQLRGYLGQRYGFEFFANQNAPTHTAGTNAAATGALTSDYLTVGVRSISFDGVTTAGTFVVGDTFTIAGDSQTYAITALSTASAGAVTGASITPGLAVVHHDNDVVTFATATTNGHVGVESMAFHRDAFALAMAPLSDMGNNMGAKIATVEDPVTNITLRSRLFYLPDSSAIVVAIDALWGVLTLNGNRACRVMS